GEDAPRHARDEERDHDRGERPERERADELAEPEHDAAPNREPQSVVPPPEDARGEQERDGREQQRERLRVEHRPDTQRDRQEAEEAERGDLQPTPSGEEL